MPTNPVVSLLKVHLENDSRGIIRFEIVDDFMEGKGALMEEAPFDKGRLRMGDDPVRYRSKAPSIGLRNNLEQDID